MANKQDVIEYLAKTEKISLREATKRVNATFNATKHILIENNHLTLRGFGRFDLVIRKARRNRTFGKTTTENLIDGEKASDSIVAKFESAPIKKKFYIPGEGLTTFGEKKMEELREEKFSEILDDEDED